VVAHEIGQWCAFPNFEEMGKYTGHLKPKNFEVFRELLAKNGLGHRERDFLMASGALQVLCYKAEIEAALRTPGFGGFQLLDLHDFPGQGTALVGVLDPFWDPKPYVRAAQYRAFCGPVVPLLRLPKRIFAAGETLSGDVEVSQFGPSDIDAVVVNWTLTSDADQPLAQGRFGPLELTTGSLHPVGSIEIPIEVTEPTCATLRVSVNGLDAANSWRVWLYPRLTGAPEPPEVLITHQLDEEAAEALRDGRTVLLFARPDRVVGGVALGFSPVFWNTAWTGGQAPHTLGILVDPEHPVFAHFPTADHTDWQWWEPIFGAGAMVITDLPEELEPLVQPIDTWFRSRRLATLFEARVGAGKLVVCSMDLESNLDERHAARQLRHSLLQYLASAAFDPRVQVHLDEMQALFRAPSAMEQLGATVVDASSYERGYEPHLAIDGDLTTMWHTAWSGGVAPHPHHLTVRLDEPIRVAGIAYTARQSQENGKIARYEVRLSDDGLHWGEPVATGEFTKGTTEQIVRLDRPRRARFLRVVSLSSINGDPYTAIAELRLLPDE
ncbi:MAG: discoidin domain-containing protein, partial [Phycisphaerales bacterium JB038]